MATETALAKKQTVVELVAEYDRARADIFQGFALIAEAERRLGKHFGVGGSIRVYGLSQHRPNFDIPQDSMKRVDREVWDRLVDMIGVRSMMSVADAKELDRQIERDELPPVSVDTVFGLLNSLASSAPAMLESAVVEVFEMLRPRSRKATALKTNSEFEVPPKVILTHLIETTFLGGLQVRFMYRQDLIALENVIHSLQGKGSICKAHTSTLEDAIRQAPEGSTDLFDFRACKNGNLHLTIKDRDALARLNQIAGGKRLRGEK